MLSLRMLREKANSKAPLSLIIVLFLVSACTLAFSSLTDAQTFFPTENVTPQSPSVPNVQYADNKVFIGIWLLNVFDYQYVTNDYTLDMYLYFFWTNPNMTTIDWQFANGYPISPSAITLISTSNTSNVRYQIYRATAHFSSAPDAINFPFDTINLTITVDVIPQGNTFSMYWLENETGIDSQFLNPGWSTANIQLLTPNNTYPLGITVPRAEMVVIQERANPSRSIQPFIPLLIFSAVCAISFLFSLKEKELVAVRIGLVTSMLVTTLLFNFTVSGTIPPTSTIALFNIFFLSVIVFMVLSLTVTIVGGIDWARKNSEKRVKIINKGGLLISLIVPVLLFFLILLLRG